MQREPCVDYLIEDGGGGGWGVGPYDVMPIDAAGTTGLLLTPLGPNCRQRAFVTTMAPPPICAYTPVAGDLGLAT